LRLAAVRHALLAASFLLTGLLPLAPPAPAPGPAPVAGPRAEPVPMARSARLAAFLATPEAAVRRPAGTARVSRSVVRRPRWVRPAAGPVTSLFGPRWGRMHEGIDFGAPYGAPIYAAGDGVVVFAGPMAGYGRLLEIRHADGTVTAYAHMSRFAVRGGRVRAGQVVAYVGSAGQSTGAHLHFEVRAGGRPVNPLTWLRQRGVRI
jgi:murein DD-endopeptidase MepM/ murein hydrolase activator NlpD